MESLYGETVLLLAYGTERAHSTSDVPSHRDVIQYGSIQGKPEVGWTVLLTRTMAQRVHSTSDAPTHGNVNAVEV